MGLLWECSKCKYRNPEKAPACKKCSSKPPLYRVWWIEYYDLNKKRRRERVGTSKRAAEIRLAQVKQELAEGKVVPEKQKGTMPFREFWSNLYLPWCEQNNSPDWLRRKKEIYRLHLSSRFADLKLKKITREQIERYQAERLKEGAAPATVNREVAVLKNALQKAVEWGLLSTNPASGVKSLKERDDAWKIIPEEDWEKILEALPESKRAFFQFLWHTGVRLGTAINLTWDMIDLKQGFMKIPASATKQKKELILPLTDTLVSILVPMRERHPESKLVFPSSTGTPYERQNLRKTWLKALKKAGLAEKGYRIHDIRHTFGARAVRAGVDIRVIKELLGHQTMDMVLRYTHVDLKALKEALERLH